MTEAEIRDGIAYMDSRSPANGAGLVARAWTDGCFRTRLLADGKAAAVDLGIDAVAAPELVVVRGHPWGIPGASLGHPWGTPGGPCRPEATRPSPFRVR